MSRQKFKCQVTKNTNTIVTKFYWQTVKLKSNFCSTPLGYKANITAKMNAYLILFELLDSKKVTNFNFIYCSVGKGFMAIAANVLRAGEVFYFGLSLHCLVVKNIAIKLHKFQP